MRLRLREIRKAKGLTLTELAARIKPEPTTAQTIGRLETGRRRVSIEWLNRIADALEVDASDLITVPNPPDCPLVAVIDAGGLRPPPVADMVDISLAADDPVAVRIDESRAGFHAGDHIICDRVAGEDAPRLAGHDAFVESLGHGLLYGRITEGGDDRFTISAVMPERRLIENLTALWAARPVLLIRDLKR